MDYKETFKSLKEQLNTLQEEHATTERRLSELGHEISQVHVVLTNLCPLAKEAYAPDYIVSELLQSFQQSQAAEMGITDRIRQLLQANPTAAFQPTDVRAQLEAAKFELTKYSNPMATIHGVLKRLVDQGQALTKTGDGKTVYWWNPAAVKK